MELRIKSWESEGLRCPDAKVQLADAVDQQGVVSIIQMPNGTGKTSTLELLRACLTGSARNWEPEKVIEFRSNTDTTEGYFRIDLAVDARPLVFELKFDFATGRALYSTTSPAIGGYQEGWKPPSNVRRFFHPDFVDLFVFDGEFASDILDAKKTNAEHAVQAMSQLYLLDRARIFAEEDKDRIVKSARVTGSRQALKQTEDKLAKVLSQIKKIKRAREKCVKELREGESKEAELKVRFDDLAKIQEGSSNALEQAEHSVDSAKQLLSDTSARAMMVIRSPHSLAPEFKNALKGFRSGLSSVELPPSTSRQFFYELAEESACICGRPLDEEARGQILQHAEHYLGQEQAGVLNAIKSQIDSVMAEENSGDLAATDAQSIGQDLASCINNYFRASTDLAEIKEQLAAPGGELADIRDELQRVSEENDKHRTILDAIDRPPEPADKDETTMCLAALGQQKRKLEGKLEALTGTVDVGERTRVIVDLLEKSKRTAKNAVQKELTQSGNRLLREILRQSPIRIESVGSHVKLQSQADASAGQKLVVGYVLLGGLLKRGAHSLPFVVDSPAGPIDHTVRRSVAKLLPEVCDQFITFVISSEKHSFTDVLGQAASQAQYITIYRALEATDSYESQLPATGVTRTDRFIAVEDRKFFDLFDMDSE